MIRPRTCVNVSDICMTIRTHLVELVSEMQEVRIATIKHPNPVRGVLSGHHFATEGTSSDSITLTTLKEQQKVTIVLSDITRFEVLPRRLITPAHAYGQMKEMERIVGL